ncbi:HPr-like protein Crh [bacterium MnTg02]|nr:HPr-like protein Crh [bacterium MnTg02]
MTDDKISGIGTSDFGPFFAEVTIRNQKGLHARASALFVKCAERFNAEVSVTRSGETVGGTSIMGLMMLAAGQGSTILVETRGAEAHDALDALTALVEAGFHEKA